MEEGRGEKDREEERGGKSKIEEEDNVEIEKSERGRERGGKNKTIKQTEFRRTVMEHIMERHKPDLNLEHNWNMEVLMEEQNILGKLT